MSAEYRRHELRTQQFGRHPQDLSLLEKISNVASAAHAPFISAASAGLFNLDSFTDLPNPRDLAKIFETVDYAKWKSFRDSDDSRYVGLALPHILMRLPYEAGTKGPGGVPPEILAVIGSVYIFVEVKRLDRHRVCPIGEAHESMR